MPHDSGQPTENSPYAVTAAGNRGRERCTENGSCRRFPRKIQTHLGEPLEPPPVSPARDPPSDWAELVQAHDDRDVYQASPAEMTAIDIRSL